MNQRGFRVNYYFFHLTRDVFDPKINTINNNVDRWECCKAFA